MSEHRTPAAKPAKTTRRAGSNAVNPVHHIGDEKGDGIGECTPGQPVSKKELNQDV
jgi:hypothetical protein